jgi:hypothetical protein
MYNKSISLFLSLLVLLSVLLVCQPAHAVFPPTINPKYDLNGDNAINMMDIIIIANHFNSKVGDARYVVRCDINGDGVINMLDIFKISYSFD